MLDESITFFFFSYELQFVLASKILPVIIFLMTCNHQHPKSISVLCCSFYVTVVYKQMRNLWESRVCALKSSI